MNINLKAKQFASYVKETPEFNAMYKSKMDLEKNKALKKKLDLYLSKKSSIYNRYDLDDVPKMLSRLNKEYEDFFNLPLISNHINNTKQFNEMMEKAYKVIESELLR